MFNFGAIDFFDFPRLQSKQEVTRFSVSSVPPSALDMAWSASKITPSSCGVLPQYWQEKLSRSKMANLVFFVSVIFFCKVSIVFLGELDFPRIGKFIDFYNEIEVVEILE